MYRLLVEKQKRQLPYYLCTGLALGLSHENLFGVGKSVWCWKLTVHKCIHDVCTAMAENILDKYVKFPVDDNLQHVIDAFDNTWRFPNCAGAVDNTHPNNCSRVSSWRLCD